MRIGAQSPLETCALALSVEGLKLFSTCHSSQIPKQEFANTFNKTMNLFVGNIISSILYMRRLPRSRRVSVRIDGQETPFHARRGTGGANK